MVAAPHSRRRRCLPSLPANPRPPSARSPPPQCLIERGDYTYLDVRPALELDAVGKFKGCVNIPVVNATWKWDAEQGKKVAEKEDNLDFIAQVCGGGRGVWGGEGQRCMGVGTAAGVELGHAGCMQGGGGSAAGCWWAAAGGQTSV